MTPPGAAGKGISDAGKHHGEAGFTLIEVIVAVTILVIIGGVLFEAAILAFKTTGATTRSLSESAGRQVLATRLLGDIQSAADVSTATDPNPDPGDPDCAGEAGVTPVLWTHREAGDGSGAGIVDAYFVRTAGGERSLMRLQCEDGIAQGDPTLLAASLGDQPVQVDCDGSCARGAATLAAAMSPDDSNAVLAGGSTLPPAGPYEIVIDSEQMTVTGGFGTSTLALQRSAGVYHPSGAPVVHRARRVTVSVPFSLPDGGDTTYSVTVARRAA